MLATGCTHEDIFDVEGEGKLILNTTVSTDMKVVSRAVEQELQDSCMIWISNEKGLVRRYETLADVPTDGIDLVTGRYVAEAWTGDSVPVSWDKRWFKGVQDFVITAGETTKVDLECKVANVGATVHYTDGMEDVLKNFVMTVGHEGDTLMFVGRETRRGYFMMPSFDKNLKYELTGTQIDGSEFNYKGVIENAKPGYEYALNVSYTQETTEVGGAIFSIEVDETEIKKENDVELIAAPKFTGYGFDVNQPIMGEQGTIGERVIYASSATKITELDVTSDLFNTWVPELGGDGFSWFEMNDTGKDALNTAGITVKEKATDDPTQSLIQIGFSKELMNALENGNYDITFKATDKDSRSTTVTMHITVSDAPVATTGSDKVSYFTATLHGTASKDGISGVGFNYRAKGESNWNHVEASYTSGYEFTAEVSGLVDRTEYEFCATSEGYESPIVLEFTTLSAQLPNAGFEDWSYTGNVLFPGTNYASTFWDSGNHGSATMNKMVTENSTKYKHSGKYSACLKSQFVGVGIFGKFAAGNIFAGNYLCTDGTDGELGWGRPFTHSPKSVKAWVKYNPGKVDNNGKGDKLASGSYDQGIIYLALVDDTKTKYVQSKSDFNNTEWPCIVKTKTSQLFDKDGANVIAYGEYVFETATEGDGMIQIEIKLDYKRPGVTPSNIIFVASASRYGDYFQGGEGSELYLDDIELIY